MKKKKKNKEKLYLCDVLWSAFIGLCFGYTIGKLIIIPILKMLNIL